MHCRMITIQSGSPHFCLEDLNELELASPLDLKALELRQAAVKVEHSVPAVKKHKVLRQVGQQQTCRNKAQHTCTYEKVMTAQPSLAHSVHVRVYVNMHAHGVPRSQRIEPNC